MDRIECPICKTTFSYYWILRKHFFTEHPVFPKCTLCGREVTLHGAILHLKFCHPLIARALGFNDDEYYTEEEIKLLEQGYMTIGQFTTMFNKLFPKARVGRTQIHRKIRSGLLNAIRVGKRYFIHVSELEKFKEYKRRLGYDI